MNRVIDSRSGLIQVFGGVRHWTGWALAALLALAPVMTGQTGTQELRLTVGKSVVIDYPSDIGRISTSNPDIVDAVPITAREILLNAKAFGQSTIVVWSKGGERSFFSVTVETSVEPLQRLLKETFPNEDVQVKLSRDSASLVGRVSSPLVAERAAALITPFVKSVVNNTTVVAGPVEKQVLLRVRFAELNRTRAEQLGVNILSTGAANTIGQTTTGQFSSARASELTSAIGAPAQGFGSQFNITDTLNIFAFRPDLNFGVFIRALQTRNVLQILAEPNLVTSNGKEANFLAGGEFPVPVLQGGGNAGAVTIQFKEYGIRLRFRPDMTENNTLKMKITSELSTIDLANAVTFAGFTIPALSTRRTETDVELGPGQSFAIGGLLDDRVQNVLFKIPGLGDIPILGQLFKSRNMSKSKTELIVMVTPEIVNPLNPGDPKPAPLMPNPGLPAALDNAIFGQEQHEQSLKGVDSKDPRRN
jgi:pilus assembly protein CpaC